MPTTESVKAFFNGAIEDFKTLRVGDWKIREAEESLLPDTVLSIIKNEMHASSSVFISTDKLAGASGYRAFEFNENQLRVVTFSGGISPFISDGEFIYVQLEDADTDDIAHMFIGQGGNYAGFIS